MLPDAQATRKVAVQDLAQFQHQAFQLLANSRELVEKTRALIDRSRVSLHEAEVIGSEMGGRNVLRVVHL